MFTQVFFCMLLLSIAWARCMKNAPVYDFQLGNVPVAVVSTGQVRQAENPFAAEESAVQQAFIDNFRKFTTEEAFVFQQKTIVLDMPDATGTSQRVLIDPGSKPIDEFPEFAQTGQLPSNLKAADIDPDTIKVIFLTHSYVGAVNALLNETGLPNFPEAKVYINQKEHEFITGSYPIDADELSQEEFDRMAFWYQASIAPYEAEGRFHVIPTGPTPVAGIELIPTLGITPGHSAVKVVGGPQPWEQMLVAGATFLSRPDQILNPSFGGIYDVDSKEALKTRLDFLSMAATTKNVVFGSYEIFPGLMFIKQHGQKFDALTAAPDFIDATVVKECN